MKEASEKAAEQAAAEVNMELAAARVEVENVRAKVQKLEKQLENTGSGATVEVLFEQLQEVVEKLQEALDDMEGVDKYQSDKMRRALARALQTLAAQMGVG